MKKRIIAFILSAFAVLTLAGCAPENNPEKYVTLGNYLDFKVSREMVEPDDETLESYAMNRFTEFVTKEELTEGIVSKEDAISVDFTGTVNGETIEGPYENYEFQLGSGEFSETVEDKLIGSKVGDTVEVGFTFPDDYSLEPELAGKYAKYTFTINHIINVILPELTDEFVSANSEYASAEALYSELKEYLEKENLSSVVWEQILKTSEIKKYPTAMKNRYVKENIEMYKAAAAENGISYEEMLKQYFGYTDKEFKVYLSEKSETFVGEELVVLAIAKREGITLSDEEYQSQLELDYVNYGFGSAEELEAYYGENYLRVHILRQRVLDRILSTVTMID